MHSTILLCSCSDDQLNMKTLIILSADSFWSSESDLQQGLIATYAALQLDGLFGGAICNTTSL